MQQPALVANYGDMPHCHAYTEECQQHFLLEQLLWHSKEEKQSTSSNPNTQSISYFHKYTFLRNICQMQ